MGKALSTQAGWLEFILQTSHKTAKHGSVSTLLQSGDKQIQLAHWPHLWALGSLRDPVSDRERQRAVKGTDSKFCPPTHVHTPRTHTYPSEHTSHLESKTCWITSIISQNVWWYSWFMTQHRTSSPGTGQDISLRRLCSCWLRCKDVAVTESDLREERLGIFFFCLFVLGCCCFGFALVWLTHLGHSPSLREVGAGSRNKSLKNAACWITGS